MGCVPGSVNSHVPSQRLLGQARAAAPALAPQLVMTPRHQPSAARFLTHCISPLFARRADSLLCQTSDAIGSKRTCRQAGKRIALTKMTPQATYAKVKYR